LLHEAEHYKLPQSVELVNQTVSVPKEPVKSQFLWRCINEYRNMGESPELIRDFENAIARYEAMRAKQAEDKSRLRVTEIRTVEHVA
jgi:hypothetical protein